jgi:hypothetical protein
MYCTYTYVGMVCGICYRDIFVALGLMVYDMTYEWGVTMKIMCIKSLLVTLHMRWRKWVWDISSNYRQLVYRPNSLIYWSIYKHVVITLYIVGFVGYRMGLYTLYYILHMQTIIQYIYNVSDSVYSCYIILLYTLNRLECYYLLTYL